MKQYEEKYDFINKALLESIVHITEMTKTDHPMVAAKVKSADKMVMFQLLFDGSVMTWKNSRVPNFLFPLTKYINYF